MKSSMCFCDLKSRAQQAVSVLCACPLGAGTQERSPLPCIYWEIFYLQLLYFLLGCFLAGLG